MFFTSLTYLIFLPAVGIVLYLLPERYRWFWLLICSTFFYYTILPVYLILFVALTILNYFLGLAIERAGEAKKLTYIISLGLNVLALAFFKYFGLFKSLVSDITGLSSTNNSLLIILPVGLSFFIFSLLSYLIEIRRGTITAEKHIGIFASSMLFFPKILQGPIERPGSLLLQFRKVRGFSYNMIAEGAKLMLWGYFKKLVVADRLALYVNAAYGNYEQHSGITLLIATLFYSFQIYADFSGYTDIALGSAKILGIDLTNNFRRPYFATSVRDFWNRWHISFSTWLRDYIFMPLATFFAGYSKRTHWLGITTDKWIFLLAVNITFIICGIWHGEGLNFIIWGILFGAFQTTAVWTSGYAKKFRKTMHISKKSGISRFFNIVVTYLLVSFAWIFFRADNAADAFRIIEKIFSLKGSLFFDFQTVTYGLAGIILLVGIDFLAEKKDANNLPFKTNHWIKETILYAVLAAFILMIGVLDAGQFVYFQF